MKLVSQVVLIAAMLAAVAGGVVLLVRGPSGGNGFEIILPTATPASVAEAKVYVSGAVRSPGVYILPEGSRLAEAIEAAGGATEGADLTAVNLAARVSDEDHWHIPRAGETLPAMSVQETGHTGRIDINSADEELLKSLPGIGEVKAQSIIRHRKANGPFSIVEDLLDVSGIGPATLDAIRDLVDVR